MACQQKNRNTGMVRLLYIYRENRGINNKIKTMKRQAYGYRDQEFFELKYYQCMTPSTDLSDKPD